MKRAKTILPRSGRRGSGAECEVFGDTRIPSGKLLSGLSGYEAARAEQGSEG